MANKIIKEQMVMFPFEFISPIELIVEESLAIEAGAAMIRGILLREGVSRNSNLYTISEMENIAAQAEGQSLYAGTMTKRDPNTGRLKKGLHANIFDNRVGRILSATFNKIKRVITFKAVIVNTPKFPHIVEEVAQGWGISIGGIAHKAKLVLDEAGRILTKILGLKLNHVQLLRPNTITGIAGAEVESVEIQESMIMYCDEETGICYTGAGKPITQNKEPKDEPEPTITINIKIGV